MATTTANIRVGDKVRPHRIESAPARPVDEARLPLDTCGFCERSLFTEFREAAPEDESIWKSPDLRAREAAEAEDEEPGARNGAFRCRHCGRVFQRSGPRSGTVLSIGAT